MQEVIAAQNLQTHCLIAAVTYVVEVNRYFSLRKAGLRG